MTVEMKSPAPLYTIAGIGPYAVPHAWRSSADLVVSVHNGTAVIPLLIGEHYTVPASAGDAGGDVILKPGPAATHAGRVLSIRRLTLVEQGWAGRDAREKGLERQLDLVAMALQDRDETVSIAMALGSADFPTYAAVQLATIPAQQQFLMVRGKGALGDGRGGLMVRVSTEPTHDGGVQSADGQWWEPRAEHSNRTIRLSHYLRLWDDHRVALIEAVKALYSSADFVALDGEGIELEVDRPVVLDHATIGYGGGPVRMDKTIQDLGVAAKPGTWVPGDAIVSFAGATGGKLRGLVLIGCRFDGSNIATHGLDLAEYFNLQVAYCTIRRFTTTGLRSRKITDDGSHGLQVIDPEIRGTFGGTEVNGIDLEDGDVVVSGGIISWVNVGILTRRGGLHVKGVHFSCADRATPSIGVEVRAPRAVFVEGCDMDGCSVFINNSTNNTWSPGSSVQGYRRIIISGNEFVPHPEHDDLSGLIIVRTRTANQYCVGFTCRDNAVSDVDNMRILSFKTTESGTWRTDWEGVVNNVGAADDPTNFPGINVLARTSDAYLYQAGRVTTIGSSAGGVEGTLINLRDLGNAGSQMPGIRSTGQGLYLRGSGADRVQMNGDGTIGPVGTAQDLGFVATPWREGRFGTLRLFALPVAANDAAAAALAQPVPVGGLYRESGGLVRMRVS